MKFARLSAGGKRIRTIGPARERNRIAAPSSPVWETECSEDYRADPDPRKTCNRAESWFAAVCQSPPEPFGNRCGTSEWPILEAGPMVRILFPPAVSQANFRLAPLARPDLVERQPELLAHHLTAAGDIEASPSHIICGARAEVRVCYRARGTRSRLRRPSVWRCLLILASRQFREICKGSG